MVDAIAPAAESLERSAAEDLDIANALRLAAEAAEAGRDATASMVAQRGRAHLRAAESVGVLDPGRCRCRSFCARRPTTSPDLRTAHVIAYFAR
ncbi:DAK2 domain-containing protein [Tessaracoccus sp. HDW20]|uniref:DAK2 domain-containing protein n=1 Tax=Tessaracoccus coleopterorum TaxID=2714950 RepID=UPI0018D4C85F|nr:DAK2 domain-containing protein [Tessaracoccus coleopterorum]